MRASNVYGKIFASMFSGSLYGDWEAIVTLTVMVVLADKHGDVDMTPEVLSARTSIPLDIIRRGIASLEAPDPKSRTPDDGRSGSFASATPATGGGGSPTTTTTAKCGAPTSAASTCGNTNRPDAPSSRRST